jgi:hypothetical protein
MVVMMLRIITVPTMQVQVEPAIPGYDEKSPVRRILRIRADRNFRLRIPDMTDEIVNPSVEPIHRSHSSGGLPDQRHTDRADTCALFPDLYTT